MIVCPEYFSAYNHQSLDYYGLSKEEYKDFGKYSPVKNGNRTNLSDVFNELTHDVDEITKGIRIKTLDKQNPYVDIDFTVENFEENIDVTTKFWNTFGRCFSIMPNIKILKLGVYSVLIETLMDVYVYFGHPGQFTSSNHNQKVFTEFCKDIFSIEIPIILRR